ncbi:MAG: phage tail tape measure protein, partial [Rhizobiales bacterium]|nr:phage tail tape measure protein [Hyphomicrobiales bacterium]
RVLFNNRIVLFNNRICIEFIVSFISSELQSISVTENESISATENEMEGFMARSLDLANKFKFTPTQVLQAHEMLALTGFDRTKIKIAIPIVLEGAIAGGDKMGIETVADKVSDILLAMKMNDDNPVKFATNMQRIMDVITRTAQISNTNMGELFTAMRDAAPVFGLLDMTIEQGAALLATMANIGFKGEKSGVATRTGLIRMINPPKPARASLAALGINISDYITVGEELKAETVQKALGSRGIRAELSDIKLVLDDKNLEGDIEKVTQKLTEIITNKLGDSSIEGSKKVNDAVFNTLVSRVQKLDFVGYLKALHEAQASAADMANLFGKRHFAKFSGPIKAKGDYSYQTYLNRIETENKGSTKRKAVTMQEGFSGQFMQMKSSAEALNITAWESGLAETFTEGMKDITEFLRVVSKTDPDTIDTIVKSIAGFAVGKYAIGAIGDTAEAMGNIGDAVSWVGEFNAEKLGQLNEYIRGFGGGAEKFADWMTGAGGFVAKSIPYIAGIAAVGGALYWLSRRHDYLGEAAGRNVDIYKKVRAEFNLTADAASTVLDVNATVARFNAVERLQQEKETNVNAKDQFMDQFYEKIEWHVNWSTGGTRNTSKLAPAPKTEWEGQLATVFRRLEGTHRKFKDDKISLVESVRIMTEIARKFPESTETVKEIIKDFRKLETSNRAVKSFENLIIELDKQIANVN